MISGILALVAFAITSWLGVGVVPVHVYLPNWPVVRAVGRVSESPALPQPSAGMTLRIPSIGVLAPVDKLGLDSHHVIQAPTHWFHTGWYGRSPVPGRPGVAMVLGHVDSHVGQAVFWNLHKLHAGNRVIVNRNGTSITFRVDSLRSYPETALPMSELLRTSGPSRLALLTCSGDFSQQTQRYDDRLVVMATRAGA
ncbi:MAG: class F sortase [Chloroflexota bacterium]